MKGAVVCLLALVLSLLLVEETECRWMFGHRHRNGRMRDHWNRFFGHMRKGWGGHRSFNFGGRHSPFQFGFSFDLGRQSDWWDGPNVCYSEDTDNSSSSDVSTITHHFKTASQVCEESETAYRCKTTVKSAAGQMTKVELHQCCHGYSRKPGQFGCPEKLRLADLLTTARQLGLNDFLAAVSSVGLDEELARGNFTVFAPQDGAFPLSSSSGFALQDQPRALMVSRPLADKLEDQLQGVLLGHVLTEPRRASSFSDEDVVATASPYDSTIRINFYSQPKQLTTANCVRVTSTDNVATNGVIHTVEKMLPTVTSSLLDIIQRDEQFSYLKTALARANLVSMLKSSGQLTLLVPTDSAFKNLDPLLLDRLLSGDPACLEKVLKQHLLPNVICSEVIQGRAKSRNLLSNFLNLTRTDDGKVFVDDAQVIRADVMATNGVMHIVDVVLVPDDALDIVSAVEKKGLTELVKLVEAAGLTSTLQNADNVTILAPSNQAIEALPADLLQKLTSDPDLLLSVLNYHVIPEELTCRELYNNRVLDTLNAQGKVRVNEYSSFPFGYRHRKTAQCASFLACDVSSCNGVVHVIDRVMLPPTGNVVDVLAADPDYSTLVRLVKVAGLADALQAEGPFTVFAPTNQAFERLGKERLREVEADREQLTHLLQLHVFPGNLCCGGIFDNPWWRHQQIATLSGGPLFLSRDRSGRPLVNDAVIGSCDNTATNGVVQGIDSVLMPSTGPWYLFP